MLHEAVKDRLKGKPRGLTKEVTARIKSQNDPWLAEWMPRLTSDSKPLSPYRVIWDLHAGGGRDEHHHHARCRQPAR